MLLHDPWLLRVQHLPLSVRWVRDARLARLGVPTLADALEVAGEVGVRLAIDTKDAGAAEAVLGAVRAGGATDRVLLWSQHMPVVRSYVRALPDAEVALLRDTFDPRPTIGCSPTPPRSAPAPSPRTKTRSRRRSSPPPRSAASPSTAGTSISTCSAPVSPTCRRRASPGVVTDWPADARERLRGDG